MNSVHLDFEIEYIKCELAPKQVESAPVLRIYGDRHFIRSEAGGGIKNVTLDEDDPSKVYKETLTFDVDYSKRGTLVPVTSNVGIASYAMRRNDFGFACYTSAGSTHVNLGDIRDALATRGTFEQELPLLLETTRLNGQVPVEKGRIVFRATGLKLGRAIRFVEADACIMAQPREQLSDRLGAFIGARVEMESAMRDTWPGIKNVRAPMDISSAGIELTRDCFLPVEGFTLSEPMVMNVPYFQNALETQLRRRNLSIAHFSGMPLDRKAELMAELLTYAAQTFDYISDTVDRSNRARDRSYDPHLKVGMEDFTNMGVTLSGDCEDGAQLECTQSKAFLAMDIDQRKNPELWELQNIAEHYTFFSTLATVHGAKADDQTEHIGAHMFGIMMPQHQVKSMLSRTPEGRAILSRLPFRTAIKPITERLPTLFCEGTGQIRPLGPGPEHYERAKTASAIAQKLIRGHAHSQRHNHREHWDPLFLHRVVIRSNMPSIAGLKTQIPHDRGGASQFYLGNLLGITSDFINLGFPLGAFVFGQVNERTSEVTRGAQFTDIINQSEHIALVPHERMPSDILNITMEATALRVPPRPFTLNVGQPMSGTAIEPNLERLKREVATWNRSGVSRHGSVDVFLRPHQFDSNTIDRMISDLGHLQCVYRVDYELEHITNEVHNYRLMFFADDEAVKSYQRK